MTKESKKPIDNILSFAKSTKRARESSAEIQARRIRTLEARWSDFIEALQTKFREFVDTFNAGNRARGTSPVRVSTAADSITATSGRMSITVAGDLDALMLMKRYTTLRARESEIDELPFYIRLGEDDQIEIHESPDEDRLISLDAFLVDALGLFFVEVVKAS